MIVCFGEVMLRLSPEPDTFLIEQSSAFRVEPGGSESNVAITLRRLGHEAAMLTILPDNILGHKVLRYLKWHNINTDRVVLHKAGRVGLYFTEKGSGIRGCRVFYDRDNSAFNQADKYSQNIEQWLKDCKWFHLSGIALATSRNAANFALMLTKKAHKKGIRISFDINHRDLLWKWCKSKSERCRYLMEISSRSTILLGNETDLEIGLFGQARMKKEELMKRLRGIAAKGFLRWVAISQRESKSADINNFGGSLYDFRKSTSAPKQYLVKPYVITNIVDRIGTGDAFGGAILDGFIKGLNPQYALKRAVMLGVLKHGIFGDACAVNADLLNHCMLNEDGCIIR